MKLGGLAGFALLFVSASALADGPNDVRLAQALFDEARSLVEQKRFGEACPKFKESQRLDPGGGTLLNLASCHSNQGKLATALDEYREALAVAQKDGRKDRIENARQNIASLEERVPRITVQVPHPLPGIDVKLDTTPLAPAAWGVATTVDPGAHTVFASAPGYQSVSVHVTVLPEDRKVVEVPAQPKEGAPAGPPSEERSAPAAFTPTTSKTKPNPVFWASLGVGLTSMVVASVTGVMTITNTVDAHKGCDTDREFCANQGAKDSVSNAKTFGWVSTIALGVGVVGLIVAMVVPSKKAVVVGQNLGLRF